MSRKVREWQFSLFQVLYPDLENCTIQIFDDIEKRKDNTLAKIWLKRDFDKLDEENKKGCGIFFSVNSMNAGKRSIADTTKVNAWICEVDDKPKSEQMELIKNCPIKPSLIVESKKSYHLYWFSEDWTIENRKKIGNWLADFFGGDRKIIEVSRVLRVPWFYHTKSEDDLFLVQIVEDWGATAKLYKESDMLLAYPYTPTERTEPVSPKKSITSSNVWEVMTSWDCEMMLTRLSWSWLISSEKIDFRKNTNGTKQIRVNDKSSGCWIDNNGLIGSPDKWWPTWIQWIKWYGRADEKDIYKRAMSNCEDLIPRIFYKKEDFKKEDKELVIKESKENDNIDFTYITPYTRWIDMPDWLGVFDKNDLVVLAGFPSMGKTEFSFFIAQKNAQKGIKTLYITLEMTKKNLFIRLARKKAWVSRQKRQKKQFSVEQKDKMIEEYKRLSNIEWLTFVSFDQSPDYQTIEKTIKEYREKWYWLFIVDNLGQIIDQKNELDTQAEATRGMRLLVNQMDAPIMLLHHLNKPQKKEQMYSPWGMWAIRGNQKIIDNATMVFELWRDTDPESEDKNIVELILYKDTEDWATGSARLKFDKWNYLLWYNW